MIQLQNKSLNDFSKEIEHLENRIDSMIDTLNYIRWGQYFTMIAKIASGLRDHHKSISTEILRMIAHTNKGEMNRLIPISQVTQNLNDINMQLPKETELPIDLLKKGKYIQYIQSEPNQICAYRRPNHSQIKIPILDIQEYTLFRAIPVPFQRSNQTFLIRSDHEFFLTDSSKSSFIPISADEFKNCMTTKASNLICAHLSPKYSILFHSCEMDTLRYAEGMKIPPACNVQQISPQNYIIELPLINQYFVYLEEKMTMSQICNKNSTITGRTINQSGILKIEENCYIL